MASNYWIKVYHEVLHDPKMGRLPDNLWRRFFECCLMAGELQQDGRIPPVHDIAWMLRIEEETLRGEFDQLARIGLLDFVNKPLDEHWIVVKFAERQAPMSAAERMERMRETKKKRTYYGDSYEPVTKRNTEEEEDKDIDIEKEQQEEENDGVVFSHYENNIAPLNARMRDELGDYIDRCSNDWIVEAINIAVDNNARRWSYIRAILDNWIEKGKTNGKKNTNKTPAVRL